MALLPPVDKLPPAMGRLTLDLSRRASPLPEYLTQPTTEETLCRAWDPYHVDTSIECQTNIRNAPNLVTVVNTIPPFYRGILSSFFGKVNDQLDRQDALLKAGRRFTIMKEKEEFPSHFNSIKVPTIQYTKGLRTCLNLTGEPVQRRLSMPANLRC